MSEIRIAVLFAFPNWLTLASSGSSSPPSCTGNVVSWVRFYSLPPSHPLPHHPHPFPVPPESHVCSSEAGCLAYLSHWSYFCAFVLGPIILFKPFTPYSQPRLFISNPPFEVKIQRHVLYKKQWPPVKIFFYRVINSVYKLTLDSIQAAQPPSTSWQTSPALWSFTQPECFP